MLLILHSYLQHIVISQARCVSGQQDCASDAQDVSDLQRPEDGQVLGNLETQGEGAGAFLDPVRMRFLFC